MKFLSKDALSILDHNLRTDEKEELKKAFYLKDDVLKWRIEWEKLKSELRFMRRTDLIKEIQMKTDITVGKAFSFLINFNNLNFFKDYSIILRNEKRSRRKKFNLF